MEEQRAYYLASKRLDGNLSAIEQAELDQWMAADPSRATLLQDLGQILPLLTDSIQATPVGNTDTEWTMLKSRMVEAEPSPKVIPMRRNNWARYAIAAAAMAVLAVGAYWIVAGLGGKAKDFAFSYATAEGEQKAFTLPDGSQVELNGGSKLYGEADFGGDARKVRLEGEAFFSVKRDETKPFEVLTGAVRTTVLGTQFNLRAYQKNGPVHLSVVEGKVKFAAENSGKGEIFVANESGVFDPVHGKVSKTNTNAGNAVAWRDGELVFDDEPLTEAVLRLNHFYDIDLRLGSGLEDARLTTRFSQDDETVMLEALATAYQARIRRDGKTVWLEK